MTPALIDCERFNQVDAIGRVKFGTRRKMATLSVGKWPLNESQRPQTFAAYVQPSVQATLVRVRGIGRAWRNGRVSSSPTRSQASDRLPPLGLRVSEPNPHPSHEGERAAPSAATGEVATGGGGDGASSETRRRASSSPRCCVHRDRCGGAGGRLPGTWGSVEDKGPNTPQLGQLGA